MTASGPVVPHWGWRVARISAFALVSVGIGAVGHAVSSGLSTDYPVLLVGVLVALLWGWLLTYGRQSPVLLLATVVLMQAAVHAASRIHGSMPAGNEHAHQELLSTTATEPAMFEASTLRMIAVHVLATLIGVVLLLRLEQRAWRTVLQVGRVLTRFVRSSSPRPGRAVGVLAVPQTSSGIAPAPWWDGVSGARGPPVPALRFR